MSLLDHLRTTIGESYDIERELGGGGMSRVSLAEDVRLRRKVVVKVLSEAASLPALQRDRHFSIGLFPVRIVGALYF